MKTIYISEITKYIIFEFGKIRFKKRKPQSTVRVKSDCNILSRKDKTVRGTLIAGIVFI